MNEIEIIIDKGDIEKKVIISSGIISLNKDENSIFSKYSNISTIIIAGNGAFPPPFQKGSRVLRAIRETSNNAIDNWRLIVPIQQKETDFFKFPIAISDTEIDIDSKKNWGVWICESQSDNFPDILLINYPFWLIGRAMKNNEFSVDNYSEVLSITYRTLLAALNATLTFLSIEKRYSQPNMLVLSDILNNLIDKTLDSNNLIKLRIRIFTQVLCDWLSKNDYFNSALITYGSGFKSDLVERAWDNEVQESKSDFSEFGDALELRKRNLKYINDLLNTTQEKYLKNSLQMAFDTFKSPTPSLSADLIQCRTLCEAISLELCRKYELNYQAANFFSYIQRMEESKKVSPWVTSYLHVIRQLGNEAAHYKMEAIRRPEKPVGKDLIVLHAALNRILAFCRDEQL